MSLMLQVNDAMTCQYFQCGKVGKMPGYIVAQFLAKAWLDRTKHYTMADWWQGEESVRVKEHYTVG